MNVMFDKQQVPEFASHAIVEYREYAMLFDEPVNVYNDKYANHFPFMLNFDFAKDEGNLQIPDCGGMLDSQPASFKQQQWVLNSIKQFDASERWVTAWGFNGLSSYRAYIHFLAQHASLTLLRYACVGTDIAELFCYLDNHLHCIEQIIVIDNEKVYSVAIHPELLAALQQVLHGNDNYAEAYCKVFSVAVGCELTLLARYFIVIQC